MNIRARKPFWETNVRPGQVFASAVVMRLHKMSRAGYFLWSAYLTLAILFCIIFYSAWTWGMDLPDNYLKAKVLRTANVIEYLIMLFYLGLLSALSNSEIGKSLNRASRFESELKQERDNLELTVIERTRELRESHLLQLSQHAQFVELGQLACGYVHDLSNPLTTLSLSMNRLKCEKFGPASEALQLALNASKRMENLLVSLRKQIRGDEEQGGYCLSQELREAAQLLGHRARELEADIVLNLPGREIEVYGSASKFHQVASNLIINAIESYAEAYNTPDVNRKVVVSLEEKNGTVNLNVADSGSGISVANLERIFDPLFSTKKGSGLGIGLSTIKTIIEKDFNGSISVFSREGQGTRFTVIFPIPVK